MSLHRKILARCWRSIFQPAARYPVDPRAVFILVLSVFSALTAIVLDAAPASLEAVLPMWAVLIWGILLCAGSAITLGGMAVQSLNGILVEQVGSIIVAAVTLFYSAVAFLVIGGDALQPVGIIVAWGFSCVVRWIQLQALIVSSYHKGKRLAAASQIDVSRSLQAQIAANVTSANDMQTSVEDAIREEMKK